ncbi:hypothetical protein FB451DRAFT_1249455 [Mycena latifolia]|nr:hypothetical protein FB451DRAFT_1249455 [Mycena latifolia]
MLILFPLIFTAQTALAAALTGPKMSLVARQSTVPSSSSCSSACSAANDLANGDDSDPSTMCTSQVVGDYVSCWDCLVASGAAEEEAAQESMDGYVSACNAAGFPVDGVTISADGGTDSSSGDTTGSSSTSDTGSSSGDTGSSTSDTGSSSSDTGGSTSSTGSSGGDTFTPPSGCESACTPFTNVVNAADTSDSALCTSQVVSDFASCYDCIVALGAVTQADAQSEMDEYVSTCNSEGFTVKGATISASSASSSGGTGSSSSSGGAGSSSGGSSKTSKGIRLCFAPATLLALLSVVVFYTSS